MTARRAREPAAPSVWAVVVAAGSGSRYGRPKQYEVVAGRSVLAWSVDVAASAADGVVVVAPTHDVDVVRAKLADEVPAAVGPTTLVVAGGATRTESVRCGLAAVPGDAAVILVHDAARPAASHQLFTSVAAATKALHPRDDISAVVPAVPVTDSIRHRSGGTVDRADLVAVQTPQGFLADRLRAAHAAGGVATDDAGLVEAAGDRVEIIGGEPTNLKLTHPHDLVALESILSLSEDDTIAS